MKRTKKKPDNRKRKVLISQREIETGRRDSAKEAVTKTGMLYLTALAEKGWSEEEIIDLFETVQRYAQYVDDHLIRVRDVQRIIEERTGIKITGGW